MSDITPKHQDATLDHVLKYTGVFGGVQGINILMGIVRNKLASKFLGAAGFGLVGFYTSIVEFVNSCSNFGIPISSVQHLSELFEEDREEKIREFIRVVRTWCLWSAVLAVFICVLVAIAYEPQVLWLTPMAVALLLTGGETSILKGLRRLKRVAVISLLGAVCTFALTVPFFWSMGIDGIIISLDCCALAIMLIHFSFTFPLYAWHVAPLSVDVFRKGLPLLKIGIPYVLSGVAGTATIVLLQSYLREYASETVLGYYRVCYTLMATYAGIIFTAFEPDYFPRLSSVNHDVTRRNQIINQQIRACVLLLTPMLISLIVLMPWLLRLLYTDEFLPVTGMAICAVFYMFFRCVTVPIAYIALARADSRIYLLMEVVYDIVQLMLIIACYESWGVRGIGIGLSASSLFDMLFIGLTYHRIYHFRMDSSTFLLSSFQCLFLSAAFVACFVLPEGWKYAVGAVLLSVSLLCSYRVLLRESSIVQQLHKRFRR